MYRERNLNELHLKVIAFKIQNHDGRGREERVRGRVGPSFTSGYSTAVSAVPVQLVPGAQAQLHGGSPMRGVG